MILSSGIQILVATKPVDFRKQADSLAAAGAASSNAVDPLAWMTGTITRVVHLWTASRIDELITRQKRFFGKFNPVRRRSCSRA